MKKTVAWSAVVAMAAATSAASADNPSGAPPATETLTNIGLRKTNTPKIDSLSTSVPTSAYSVEFQLTSTTSIETGKFKLGGMDSDVGASAIANIPKDKCGKYLLQLQVYKKNGAGWDTLVTTTGHGEWRDSTKPGEVSRCELKDGAGSAPSTWTKTLSKPRSGTDIYRVVVEAGFATTSWPASATAKISEHRQVVATIALAD